MGWKFSGRWPRINGLNHLVGFPGGSDTKATSCKAGDWSYIPGEGNGNSLQYSYLENCMDEGALWAPVHGVAKSLTPLSDFTFFLSCYGMKWNDPHFQTLKYTLVIKKGF